MSDWMPPTGPPRPGSAPVPATAPAAPTLPPPSGAPSPGTAPRRVSGWVIAAISAGGVVLVAGLIGGIVGIASLASSLATSFPVAAPPQGVGDGVEEPVLSGDPGEPVAAESLECDACFDRADVLGIAVAAGPLVELGFTDVLSGGTSVSVAREHELQSSWWSDDGGSPDACYFSYPEAPFVLHPDESTDVDDSVAYEPMRADEEGFTGWVQATRIFPDSASAVAHMAALADAIAGCPSYRLPGWQPQVTAAAAHELPGSVAGYGWVEATTTGRYYVVDLQRGNLVTRLSMWSDGWGPSEADFRDLAVDVAAALAELDPES